MPRASSRISASTSRWWVVSSPTSRAARSSSPASSALRARSVVTLIATSGIPGDDAGLASGLYNTAQQVGGSIGLAILSTLAASKTEDVLLSAGGRPQPAEEAQALVDGFHVAYVGSALLIAGGLLALLFLIKREDVVAVGEGSLAEAAA